MSLKPADPQRSFYHTSTLCGEMFAAADRYRLFREKILPKLFALRSKLESLYCENNGRPAVDPVLLVGVTLLQFMEKVADRLAAEQVVYHLGWKFRLRTRRERLGSRAERGRVSSDGLGLFPGSIGGKESRASDF